MALRYCFLRFQKVVLHLWSYLHFLHYNKRHDARSLRKLLDENPVFYKSCLEVSDIHLGTAQKAVFRKFMIFFPDWKSWQIFITFSFRSFFTFICRNDFFDQWFFCTVCFYRNFSFVKTQSQLIIVKFLRFLSKTICSWHGKLFINQVKLSVQFF